MLFSPFEFLALMVAVILLGVMLQVGIGNYGISFGVTFQVMKGEGEHEDDGDDSEGGLQC